MEFQFIDLESRAKYGDLPGLDFVYLTPLPLRVSFHDHIVVEEGSFVFCVAEFFFVFGAPAGSAGLVAFLESEVFAFRFYGAGGGYFVVLYVRYES